MDKNNIGNVNVRPNKSDIDIDIDIQYINYNQIEQNLTDLIKFYNNIDNDNKILKTIIFFSEFLRIHPFIDGNGRILFSYLLKDIFVYPISLCKSIKMWNIYIDVLERRHFCLDYDYNNNLLYLIEYIHMCIKDNLSIFNYIV